jgi:hypothetical protein
MRRDCAFPHLRFECHSRATLLAASSPGAIEQYLGAQTRWQGRGSLYGRSGSEKDPRLADKLRDPGRSRSLGPFTARHEFLQRMDKIQTPLTSLPFFGSRLLDLSSELLEFTLDAYFCVAHCLDSVVST